MTKSKERGNQGLTPLWSQGNHQAYVDEIGHLTYLIYYDVRPRICITTYPVY